MDSNIKATQDYSLSNKNDEINLNIIYFFILRNRKIIFTISLIFSLIASLYSLTIKRIWEGKFQILLEDTNNLQIRSNISSTNSFLVNQLFQNNIKSDLVTQVGILESPSVLMPVFELVKTKNKPDKKKLFFSDWKKNLNIQLQDNTSILNLSYRDNNKEIILPVLEKITKQYQEYSSKNRKKSLNSKKNYLIKQISIFRKKSSNSLTVAQEYAIDKNLLNNLPLLDKAQFNLNQENSNNTNQINNLISSNTSIENIRVLAANKIKNIDKKLKTLAEKELDLSNYLLIVGTIPSLSNQELPKKLSQIESELVLLKTKLTDKDILVKTKIKELEGYEKLIKEKIISYLKAERLDYQDLMQSSMRPKEILLKYKKLVREASRDEITLIQLENNLRALELEESIIEDPWKLITKPTLLNKPVGPRRKIITFLGLLLGFFFGNFIALYREIKSGIIYDKQILEKLLPSEFTETINLKDIELETEKLSLLRGYIANQLNENISIIPLGKVDLKKVSKFKNSISNKKNIKNINLIASLEEISKFKSNNKYYVIAEMNLIDKKETIILKKYLQLYDISLGGIILFQD
tara:strand:- start:532 stop:2271 length:1740 start_codon:yes stop_codon:yes gene_type:complete